MPKKVEISHRTIIFTLSLLLLAKFISKISDILIMLFIAFILMSAINPLIDRLDKFRLPRSVSILIVYLVLWSAVGSLLAGLVPPLVDQTARLLRLLPSAVSRVEFFSLHQQEISQQFLSRVGSLPENVLRITIGLFGNFLNVLTTLVITFYLLLYHRHLDKYLTALVGDQNRPRAVSLLTQIERRLGGWVRGEVILMFAVGTLTYLGLLLLGIDIALPLAILAGILEILPNIGPTISAIPAVLVALTIHPLLALATVALYMVVQIVENNFLVPNIMQKAAGVNPLVSIIGLMVGFRIAGPVGAVLALPLIITGYVIGVEFFPLKKFRSLASE